MLRTLLYLGILIALSCCRSSAPCESSIVDVIKVQTDSLFNGNQLIHLATLEGEELDNVTFEIAHYQEALLRTDDFAERYDAVMAINGGYFDMNDGGSVTYFEENDTLVSSTKTRGQSWAIPRRLLTGAIIIYKDGKLAIDRAQDAEHYLASKEEQQVLVTGPLLMRNGKKVKLPPANMSRDIHPRSCLCIGDDFVTFMTVDGRQSKAKGANLYDLQWYAEQIGCRDAINLDGGGSTTLVVEGCGIVNSPSDFTGPRPVANAIVAVRKGS